MDYDFCFRMLPGMVCAVCEYFGECVWSLHNMGIIYQRSFLFSICFMLDCWDEQVELYS